MMDGDAMTPATAPGAGGVRLAPLPAPYPYRSALAFVSDIDSTTYESLFRVHRMLYGLAEGYEDVALETSNSYWVFTHLGKKRKCEVALAAADLSPLPQADAVGALLRTPIFDTLHTYGDVGKVSFDHDFARRCVDLLHDHGLAPAMWTYHGNTLQTHNIAPGADHWHGDDPGHASYHLDLLRKDLGLRFFRRAPSLVLDAPGVSDGEVVQTRDGSWIYQFRGAAFLRNVPREEVDAWLVRLRAEGRSALLDRHVFKPQRQFPDNVLTWTPEMLRYQLSEAVLDDMVAGERVTLVNQHLTRAHCVGSYEAVETRDALRRLTRYGEDGRLLTTSGARLLMFKFVRDNVEARLDVEGEVTRLRISPVAAQGEVWVDLTEERLSGIAFPVPGPEVVATLGPARCETLTVERDERHGWVARFPWESRLQAQRDAVLEFETRIGAP
ncbi:hypothetical protein JQC91_17075 [Jannaschia sp. Os4]|uniref:hypothetical protein n=1 Tax=Jannaschia sp. Os4 TaxID=2807617 RepID=UPI00193945B6|nr:hypothetical protein [Jannaschia sp. Os4]MBM2578021.1 hypothetical protein [Jannaschia sp. Os4]